MAFQIKSASLDLGLTPLENLFINDFMPMANGTHVKVYLMGYYFALTAKRDIDNKYLAKHLNMSLEDIVAAWHFWREMGIVELTEAAEQHQKHQFDVTFLSIRQLYIENNYSRPQQIQPAKTDKLSDRMFSAFTNPHIKKLLLDIQMMVRRDLTANETSLILDFIEKSKMDLDLIYRAFYITFEERAISKHPFKYVKGIIKNWYDQHIFTMAELEASQSDQTGSRFMLQREVAKKLGMGQRMPASLKRAIDDWLDEKNYSAPYILYVIDEASKRSLNPNINYLISIFNDLSAKGINSIEAAKLHFAAKNNRRPRSPNTSRSFQNFSEATISKMTEAELQKILEKKQVGRRNGQVNE